MYVGRFKTLSELPEIEQEWGSTYGTLLILLLLFYQAVVHTGQNVEIGAFEENKLNC